MRWYSIRQSGSGWRIETVREQAALDGSDVLAWFGPPEFGEFEDARNRIDAAEAQGEITGSSPLDIVWQHDGLRGSLRLESRCDGAITICCEAITERLVTMPPIAWRWRFPIEDANVLSHGYRWQPLQESQVEGRLTPLAMTGQRRLGRLTVVAGKALPAFAAARLSHSGVELTVWLDHPLAHPRFTFDGPQFRNWHNEYRFESGRRVSAVLHLLSSDRPWPLVLPGRYPAGYRGVFSITDHADHDSCPKLAALWYGSSRRTGQPAGTARPDGFVGLKLPMTKSVFTATPEPDGPGLHHAPFAELCRAGYRAGVEICPHGIHSTNQPQVSEIPALLEPFREFEPKTWIDHGNRFLSNYGRRGWNPDDEFSLLPWLDDLGIRYVWGRIDFGHALPGGKLNQLAVERFRGLQYLGDLPQSVWRAMRTRRPWAALHGLSCLAFQLLPEPTMLQYFRAQRAIQRVMRADVTAIPTATWNSLRMAGALAVPPGAQDVWRHLKATREEVSLAPIFFPEHQAVRQGNHDRWLFNTVAVHDVAQAYAPAAIDTLIDEYGVHLSHTYLTSISRAHLSHAVEPDGGGEWRLTQSFSANLRHLADRRDAGQLWVASMAEIGDFWSALSDVRIDPVEFGVWKIRRPPEGSNTPLAMQWVTDAPSNHVQWRDESLPLHTMHAGMKRWAKPMRAGDEVEVRSSGG